MYSIAEIEKYVAMRYAVSPDELYLVPYGYCVSFEPLANGTQGTAVLNMSANADFLLLGIRHVAYTADSDPTIFTKEAPNVRALITDTSSGDQFTNGAANLESFSTNGMGELSLEFPRLLRGRSALSIQVNNIGSDDYAELQMFFHGVLVRAWSNRPTPGQLSA